MDRSIIWPRLSFCVQKILLFKYLSRFVIEVYQEFPCTTPGIPWIFRTSFAKEGAWLSGRAALGTAANCSAGSWCSWHRGGPGCWGVLHGGLDHFLDPKEHLLYGSVWVWFFFSIGFCQNDSTDQQLDWNFWILWDSLGLWPSTLGVEYEIHSDIPIWWPNMWYHVWPTLLYISWQIFASNCWMPSM